MTTLASLETMYRAHLDVVQSITSLFVLPGPCGMPAEQRAVWRDFLDEIRQSVDDDQRLLEAGRRMVPAEREVFQRCLMLTKDVWQWISTFLTFGGACALTDDQRAELKACMAVKGQMLTALFQEEKDRIPPEVLAQVERKMQEWMESDETPAPPIATGGLAARSGSAAWIHAITVDPQAGAAHIAFASAAEDTTPMRINVGGVLVFKLGRDGRLAGIEVLDPSLARALIEPETLSGFQGAGIHVVVSCSRR